MKSYEQVYEEVRQRFAPFIEERVNAYAQERDRHSIPLSRELMHEAAEIGMVASTIPQDVGGPGQTAWHWGLTLQAIGYLCEDSSFPLLVSYRGAVCNILYETGRSDLIEQYARPMAQGKSLGSFAYTEGNDPFSGSTRSNGVSWLVSLVFRHLLDSAQSWLAACGGSPFRGGFF